MAGKAELLKIMNSLQSAVAVTAHDPTWRDQVGERLTGLRRAFAEHVGATEGPDGLYHELVNHAPRLAPGVHGLVRDHRSLLDSMEGLEAAADTGDPDLDQLRGWARQLIHELYEHRQRGADLLYEAYGTDIGGET
ncbi:MAG TPA: hypothetical protein VFT95_14555 [Micromonosporaceae bacterium]|nr:hypothetical protein [Micromonosporaceae bacterium]